MVVIYIGLYNQHGGLEAERVSRKWPIRDRNRDVFITAIEKPDNGVEKSNGHKTIFFFDCGTQTFKEKGSLFPKEYTGYLTNEFLMRTIHSLIEDGIQIESNINKREVSKDNSFDKKGYIATYSENFITNEDGAISETETIKVVSDNEYADSEKYVESAKLKKFRVK